MDTGPARPRFLLPARRRWPRWAWALTGVVTALAVLGLGASVAASMAQGELRARLDTLEQRTGRRVVVGRIELGVTTGLVLRDVRVTRPDGVSPQIAVAEVRTDLTPLAVLSGRRRPDHVTLAGLEAAVAARVDGGHDLEDLVEALRGPGAKAPGAEAGPARPLTVEVEGGALDVTLAGVRDVSLPRLRLRDVSGRLARDEERRVSARAQARVDAGAEPVAGRFEWDAGVARAEFASGLSVRGVHAGRPVVASVGGVSRAVGEGATELADVSVTLGDATLAVGRLVATDDGASVVPRPERVRAVEAAKVVAARGGRRLEVAEVELALAPADDGPLPVRPTRVVARDVKLAPGGGAARIRVGAVAVDLVEAPWAPLIAGEPLDALKAVTVSGPELRLSVHDRSALQAMPGHRLLSTFLDAAQPAAVAGTEGAPLPALPVRAGFEDGLLARLGELALEVRDGRLLMVDDAAGGQGVFGLDQLGVTVARRADGTRVVASDALIVRASGATGAFELSVSVGRDGALQQVQGQVRGKDFAHIVSRFSDHLVVEPDAEVDVRFDYRPPEGPGRPHKAVGTAKVRDFGFQSWRISHAPVRGLEGEVGFTVEVEPERHRARLQLESMRLGQARLTGSLTLERPPGQRGKVDARVSMPRQRCDRVAEAIPEVLVPRLAGWRLRGEMQFDALLTVDLDKPAELELKVDGDVERCEVLSLGREIDLEALRGRGFVHHPVEPTRGRLEHVKVGPGTREWVASHLLPDFVKAAAIVTEDRNFLNHKGVRWELVARALKLDLEKERFVYGGSTITQQLVKNLYLTREKTLARKLEELIISWQMERVLTKDEILTMYINVIEYGPDLYGIKRASRHYFGKLPWELSPLEAAFIMGLKPYPHAGYKQWEAQTLNHWWVKRVSHVMDMMQRREKAITETEVLAAAPYQPLFRKPEEPLWLGREYLRPTEPPPGAERPTPIEGELEDRLPPSP